MITIKRYSKNGNLLGIMGCQNKTSFLNTLENYFSEDLDFLYELRKSVDKYSVSYVSFLYDVYDDLMFEASYSGYTKPAIMDGLPISEEKVEVYFS